MLNGTHDRANGRTFSPEHLGWLDFETRSGEELGDVGAMVYANHSSTTAIVLAFAIGDGPVHRVAVDKFGKTLGWEDMPIELLRHHAKVMNGTAVWAAWNAGFDRAIWNYACGGFPELEPHMIIDVMAQATANGLPPDLSMAAKLSHSIHKVEAGKDLIKLFCTPGGQGTPQTHPEEWHTFVDVYAPTDILAMRSVFNGTRQLTMAEWKEYWAAERVNDRGIAIDVPMARRAADLAREDKVHSGVELQKLTNGAVQTVGQVQAIVNWLIDRLPPEGRQILVSREEELDDDGELVRPAKMSLKRNRVEKLIAYCQDRCDATVKVGNLQYADRWQDIIRVLEIRRFGGSTTPAKFQKMLDQHHDGALYGSYVFNGAPQTGRFSSRGVQIHNLTRDFLPYELEAIEELLR